MIKVTHWSKRFSLRFVHHLLHLQCLSVYTLLINVIIKERPAINHTHYIQNKYSDQ